MSFTAAELDEFVMEEYSWKELMYELEYPVGNTVSSPYGDIELVENYGGEGQGEQYWLVVKVDDRLFRIDGYYQSFDGGYLDGDLYEVQAKEKTITVYE